MDPLKEEILSLFPEGVSDAPKLTTDQVVDRLALPLYKSDVLSVLLQLKDERRLAQRKEGSETCWSYSAGQQVAEAPRCSPQVRLLIVIDLGNCHDCLQPLQYFIGEEAIRIRAYADLAFNGYGVNPPVVHPHFYLYHATSAAKNAADVALIWDISRFTWREATMNPTAAHKIIVVTKDLQFQSLKGHVEEHAQHRLIFETNWEGLRRHL